jgi:hypothetical protein
VCLIVPRLPPGRNPYAVKINNNNKNNNNHSAYQLHGYKITVILNYCRVFRRKAGLIMNAEKTKYMRVMRNSPRYVNI